MGVGIYFGSGYGSGYGLDLSVRGLPESNPLDLIK